MDCGAPMQHDRPMTEGAGEAARLADQAAARAGVQVRLLSEVDELHEVTALIDRTWGEGTDEVSVPMLRAMTMAGNFVSGAFDGERLVGICVAFFGTPRAAHLHSHLAAVDTAYRGRGVGFALKVHQWAWAYAGDVATISWTYDPLQRRNAFLNLARLRATPTAWLANFYGNVDDDVNGTEPTDRLLVSWSVAAKETRLASARETRVVDGAALEADGASVLLTGGPHDEPVERADDGAGIVLIGVPADITAVRRDDIGRARAWREAVERTLGAALLAGHRVTGFTAQGQYVVER